ncbi:BTAD domain-containing putative transcriptional regulator [Streptomyces sp. NPDC090106]|uniref:BTAD domain-containing putative transcriptional regulator n=1 Tax=Streptomyces sp. NPDC090106 TaxID=3365946 RepID=UPI00382B04CD
MASSGGQLRLQILGPLRIWRDGVELDPGPRQQSYLLAILLARAGRPISTSELVDLIWGEDVPASAVNILQKYVGALRRLLEPSRPVREAGSFLHRRGNSYLFAPGPTSLDLVAFREGVDAARAALTGHEREAALGHYVSALGLWHGSAGDGIADGIADGTAATTVFAALDNEFYDACTAAAELAVSVDQPERVLTALQLAASMGPFNEPVLAALVGVLGATGRQAEALAVFRQVRDRLADELGIDPGPALEDAQQRILTQPRASPPVREEARTVGRAASATLIGRTEELATLRHLVERALAGDTAIGIVEGEPGAGKTRLLEEAAAVAGELGALTVWGSCLEGDGTPAMWPWEQALDRLVRSLPDAAAEQWLTGGLASLLTARDDSTRELPDGNAQFRLFEQVVALVRQASARRPTLLVLDDLQWADATSLQLLQHLTERLPHGTAIVGALRDRAPTVGPVLSRVLAAVSRRPGHRRFRLGPLAPAHVAQLIRHEAGQDPGDAVARAIHARTSGNPFFVRELSRLLTGAGAIGDHENDGDGESGAEGVTPMPLGVPSTVHDVVRDRMSGLDDRARALLQVAAVIGRDVDLRLLSRATGVGVADCLDRLEPLHTLGLLEPGPRDPSSLRFAHDLVRESVSETATRQQATRLHLRVADALEQIHADDEDVAERLAYHLWAAGPLAEPVRAAQALIRAGRRAAAKLAFESAHRQLHSAVQLTRASGLMELEFSALTLLAIVVRRQAGYDASTFDLLDRAEYLARTLGREAEAADFLFIRTMGAYTSIEQGRGELARRLHELGQVSSDPAVRRYGRHTWGLHQWDIGNIGEAYRTLIKEDTTAVGGALAPDEETPLRRDGGIPGEGPGWRAVMTALHGDVDTALAFVDTWDTPGDPYAASVWVYYTTMIASMAGDAEAARRAGERWAAVGFVRLDAHIDHYIRQFWCWARALTGEDPAGAAAEAEEALVAHLLDPPQWGVAYHCVLIAEMWLAAGAPDRAEAALDRADQAIRDHGQRYAEGLLLLLRACLLRARGAPVTVVRAAAERAYTRSTACEAHLFARRAERLLSESGGTA